MRKKSKEEIWQDTKDGSNGVGPIVTISLGLPLAMLLLVITGGWAALLIPAAIFYFGWPGRK